MLNFIKKNDLVLFGELHNNPISHWLQLELVQDIYQQKKLILGFEMIERDNQYALNQYINGEITQVGLDTLARLWKNYKTDYKPLVDFAKEKKVNSIATNIPRKYANMVYKSGFEALDTLSINEKKWIAPLPILYDEGLSQYQKMIKMMPNHTNKSNFPKAQAIKDATMAYSITENILDNAIFIHFNGSYHSDFYQGIHWYVKKMMPKLKIATISTVSQQNLSKLDKKHLQQADFIIAVDEDMTKTY